ncbi:hypothetical protein PTI98_008884 [Pleurotus ostreatus]|nr:hypothetical protein PTI98_008884 [Pleurotus ostreatus]
MFVRGVRIEMRCYTDVACTPQAQHRRPLPLYGHDLLNTEDREFHHDKQQELQDIVKNELRNATFEICSNG